VPCFSSAALVQVGSDRDRPPGLGLKLDFLARVAHFQWDVARGFEGGADEFAGGPRDGDFDAAAGAESGDGAVGKGLGQGGEQVDEGGVAGLDGGEAGGSAVGVVALQQHLGDARGCAEIAVDLEGRMRVEHVRE
jgi:hypothetical protein